MRHILIADCSPSAGGEAYRALGGPSNVQMFEAGLRLHAPDLRCLGFNLADGEALPLGMTPGDADGVVLTGSPLHVPEGGPEVERQIEFARTLFATDRPVWGSCWGLQLAAAALGGRVRTNPRGREIGVARGVALTEAGRGHPMLAGRPAVFEALCFHLDEVEAPPPGAEVLAGNAMSAVQAMALRTPGGGSFHGVQYHPEMTFGCVAALMRTRGAALAADGFGDVEAYAADLLALEADPGRMDLAWRYGIGPEVLDRRRHTVELGNWLRAYVPPRR